MKKILVLDDDRELCDLLIEFLSGEGFAVRAFLHPDEALKEIPEEYNLLIIDVMLPEMNGFEVLKKIRSRSMVPIIMLTARGEELDRILGLELGADDYLPKPFSPRELAARIRAIFRRSDREPSPSLDETLQAGELRLLINRRKAFCGKEEIHLTALEFQLLELFMREAGKVLKRQDLALQVLDRPLSYDDRSLDVHISNLRKKIAGKMAHDDLIQTVRGVGYIFSPLSETKE